MTAVHRFPSAVLACDVAVCAAADPVAPGFTLSVLTDDVPNARQMALAESGLLFVGTRRAGKVYAVVPAADADADPEVVTFASGLVMPSGVALLGDDLYVAALDRILRYPHIAATYRSRPRPEIVTDELPDARHHGWKYLSVGPDGFLYTNVGAPCNICKSDDPRFASIVRMDPATGETTVYAHGVRNSVGMAWHPETVASLSQRIVKDRISDWLAASTNPSWRKPEGGETLPRRKVWRVPEPTKPTFCFITTGVVPTS